MTRQLFDPFPSKTKCCPDKRWNDAGNIDCTGDQMLVTSSYRGAAGERCKYSSAPTIETSAQLKILDKRVINVVHCQILILLEGAVSIVFKFCFVVYFLAICKFATCEVDYTCWRILPTINHPSPYWKSRRHNAAACAARSKLSSSSPPFWEELIIFG